MGVRVWRWGEGGGGPGPGCRMGRCGDRIERAEELG